jgi:hypothetical protein
MVSVISSWVSPTFRPASLWTVNCSVAFPIVVSAAMVAISRA